MEITRVLELPVTSRKSVEDVAADVDRAIADGSTRLYTFVNPRACWLWERDPEYRRALEAFDGVFCDGIGLVVAGRMLGVRNLHRISFDSTSLAPPILELCSQRGLGIYLIGGADGVAARAAEVVLNRYPKLEILGSESGYLADFDEAVRKVRNSGAPIVISGMGAPLQERFLLELKKSGWSGVGFTCGGYLDQLGGGFDYYPAWIDRLNLRFAYRLASEPRRLMRRYTLEYAPFYRRFVKALARRIASRT